MSTLDKLKRPPTFGSDGYTFTIRKKVGKKEVEISSFIYIHDGMGDTKAKDIAKRSLDLLEEAWKHPRDQKTQTQA